MSSASQGSRIADDIMRSPACLVLLIALGASPCVAQTPAPATPAQAPQQPVPVPVPAPVPVGAGTGQKPAPTGDEGDQLGGADIKSLKHHVSLAISSGFDLDAIGD